MPPHPNTDCFCTRDRAQLDPVGGCSSPSFSVTENSVSQTQPTRVWSGSQSPAGSPCAGAAGRFAVQREERQALPAASSPGHSEAATAGHITEGSATSLSRAARSAPHQAADTHKVTEPRWLLLLCSVLDTLG